MHANDGFVADWKQQVVARALAGQGLQVSVAGVTTSPPQNRRRARLSARPEVARASPWVSARSLGARVPPSVPPSVRSFGVWV